MGEAYSILENTVHKISSSIEFKPHGSKINLTYQYILLQVKAIHLNGNTNNQRYNIPLI